MAADHIAARHAPTFTPWMLEAGAEITHANLCFLEKLAEMQAAWLASWWSLQAGWMRAELPTWRVRQNGTEQLG